MQKITPFLWFDGNAEEAVNFYVSIFKNSKVLSIARYGEAGPGPKGTVMTAAFQLNGQEFVALNGGPQFQFDEAVSFQVATDDQAETDRYWNAITQNGGQESMCGWCKDRYGLSWQITPRRLTELIGQGGETAARAFKAMMDMKKIDIAALDRAVEGVST